MDLDGQGRGPYHSRSRSDGGQEGDELAAAGRRTGLSAWLSFSSRSSLREPPGGDGGAEGGEGAEEETGGGGGGGAGRPRARAGDSRTRRRAGRREFAG